MLAFTTGKKFSIKLYQKGGECNYSPKGVAAQLPPLLVLIYTYFYIMCNLIGWLLKQKFASSSCSTMFIKRGYLYLARVGVWHKRIITAAVLCWERVRF